MILLRPNIAAMKGYVPGFQPADDIAPGSSSTPTKTPTRPRRRWSRPSWPRSADGDPLRTYPSASSQKLREVAGELYGFDPSWIIMANGSDEVLNNLIRAFAGEGEEVGYVHPSYSYYATLAEIQGAEVRTFGLTDDFRIEDFPEHYEGKVSSSPPPTPRSASPFPSPISRSWRSCGDAGDRRSLRRFCRGNALELVKNSTTSSSPAPFPRATPWPGCASASPLPARKSSPRSTRSATTTTSTAWPRRPGGGSAGSGLFP